MTNDRPKAPMRAPRSLAPHTRAAGPTGAPLALSEADPMTQAPLCLDSQVLLRGNNSVEITHRGTVYRLQATRQGKLILTK